MNALSRLQLHLRSSERLHAQTTPTSAQATPTSIPTQALVYLKRALEVATHEGRDSEQRQLCVSLA